MAGADYRGCDKCGNKTFYDAHMNYDEQYEEGEQFKICGKDDSSWYKLERLGDWAVLCRECSKTYKCEIVPIIERIE